MENIPKTITQLISQSYADYYRPVYLYIYYKVNNREEAEDLTHDVFLRLMEYKQMLRPDTVKFFIYTISRNLVTDYLRRYYKKQEIVSWLYDDAEKATTETESRIVADNLLALEKQRMQRLPAQRRKVYAMSRFGEKSVADISSALNLSVRTVENHLRIGRHEVRNFIRQCI